MEKKLNLTVTVKDIKNVGHTSFQDDNSNLNIITSIEMANIEEMFLRTILQCFGEEYKIIDTYDIEETLATGEEVIEIQFVTNLPWEIYMSIK